MVVGLHRSHPLQITPLSGRRKGFLKGFRPRNLLPNNLNSSSSGALRLSRLVLLPQTFHLVGAEV
jgi:hypothetical protein